VAVRGVVDQYAGLTQIAVEEIELLGSGSLHTPKVVNTLNESTESNLIRINNLTLTDPGTWDQSGASFNVEATNGVTTIQIRIDSDVDTDPFDDGYQLLPRYLDDIINNVSVKNPDLSAYFNLGPNPFSNLISLEASIPVTQVVVQNNLGQIIYSNKQITGTHQIMTHNWPAGFYTLTCFTEKGNWVRKISRQ
jgi:hypothetical protein